MDVTTTSQKLRRKINWPRPEAVFPLRDPHQSENQHDFFRYFYSRSLRDFIWREQRTVYLQTLKIVDYHSIKEILEASVINLIGLIYKRNI